MTMQHVTQESKPLQTNKCFTIEFLLRNTENKKKRIYDTSMHCNGSSSHTEGLEPRHKKEKLTQMVQPMPRVQQTEYQVISYSKPNTISVPTSVSGSTCSDRDSNSASDEDELDILYEDDEEDDSSPPSSPDGSNKDGSAKPKKSKRRILFSKEQIEVLERKFFSNRYVTAVDRDQLARELNLSPNQIKIWFQNHRYKTKKSGEGFDPQSFTQLANHFYLTQQGYPYSRAPLPGMPLDFPYLDTHVSRLDGFRIPAAPEFNFATRLAAASPLRNLPLPPFPHMVNLGAYYHPHHHPSAYYQNAFQESIAVAHR